MNEPKKLIREFYKNHGITHGAPLLFSYVRRKNDNGDAVVDYYAAKYGYKRGVKGKKIVAKKVMTFNPDTMRYSVSDSVISYTTWSAAGMDHLIYDFRREMTGQKNYINCPVGNGEVYRLTDWSGAVMPTSEIPLNGFEGTKYQYCKYLFKSYDISTSNIHSFSYWAKNPYGNLPDYLVKFNINPRAMEIFASLGMTKYMKESFLTRLRDDEPFAKWYKRHAKETLGLPIYRIEARFRRENGKSEWENERDERKRVERIRAQRRLARQQREEERRKREIEKKKKNELAERKQRILDLYLKLKSICGMFGAYEVIVPKNERQMKAEGKRMHNCIGRMYPCRQGIDAIILFLHKNGKPFVDIEVDPFTFKVKQCRKVCNGEADIDANKKANELAAKIKEIYKKAA